MSKVRCLTGGRETDPSRTTYSEEESSAAGRWASGTELQVFQTKLDLIPVTNIRVRTADAF